NTLVGVACGCAHSVFQVPVYSVALAADFLHGPSGHLAGYLSSRMASHAIGHQEQILFRVCSIRVLVRGPHHSLVTLDPELDIQGLASGAPDSPGRVMITGIYNMRRFPGASRLNNGE